MTSIQVSTTARQNNKDILEKVLLTSAPMALVNCTSYENVFISTALITCNTRETVHLTSTNKLSFIGCMISAPIFLNMLGLDR